MWVKRPPWLHRRHEKEGLAPADEVARGAGEKVGELDLHGQTVMGMAYEPSRDRNRPIDLEAQLDRVKSVGEDPLSVVEAPQIIVTFERGVPRPSIDSVLGKEG